MLRPIFIEMEKHIFVPYYHDYSSISTHLGNSVVKFFQSYLTDRHYGFEGPLSKSGNGEPRLAFLLADFIYFDKRI
jgi:hypothetical protein